MKFLCIACDQAMRLSGTAGPDAGSLTVTFACPACGHRVAMLTNPWETQMVRTLGVKVGGAAGRGRPRRSPPSGRASRISGTPGSSAEAAPRGQRAARRAAAACPPPTGPDVRSPR